MTENSEQGLLDENLVFNPVIKKTPTRDLRDCKQLNILYLFSRNKFEPLIGRQEEIDSIKDVITFTTEFKQNNKRNTLSATRQHIQIV